MSLRFTDTNKWRDPWYMDLPVLLKLLWLYVCDACDNAGVWVVNTKLAEFEIGVAVDWTDALERFQGRVSPLENGRKWHLIKFVAFQNPRGLGTSHPHEQIKRLMASHGIDPSPASLNPMDRVGGSLSEGSVGASKTRPDQTSPDQGGMQGGDRKINLRPILAEFGLSTATQAFAEWKAGLAHEAKCRSADEVRVFLRWATDICAANDLKVEYWRHVKNLAQEWDSKYRTSIWKAA